MIIFLIGFMGSGKSTTGKKLAGRLGYAFLDTDRQIAREFGMNINEIFDRLGESRFRESEARLLKEIILRRNVVVSTGGGLPCHGDNMDIINRNGVSIYLKLSPSDLYQRLSGGKRKRPLIRDLSDSELLRYIERKLSEREFYYLQSRFTVDGRNPNLDELVGLLRD